MCPLNTFLCVKYAERTEKNCYLISFIGYRRFEIPTIFFLCICVVHISFKTIFRVINFLYAK